MTYTPDQSAILVVSIAVARGQSRYKIRRIVESNFGVSLTEAEFEAAFEHQLECGREEIEIQLLASMIKRAREGDVRAAQTALELLVPAANTDF